MNPFAWAVSSVREKGWKRTFQIGFNVFADLAFDWKYGTDTMRWVDVNSLQVSSDNQARSAPYQATKVRPFLGLLGQLPLPDGSVFVDLGSGKGRVLLLASQYPFKRIVGLEFSGHLCATARNNVKLFQRKARVLAPVEVIKTDVTRYSFQDDENVFYMYNPFDAQVLAQALIGVRKSIEQQPRKVWMIYNTPMQRDTIDQAGLFVGHQLYEIGGTEFRVYHN